MWSNSQLIHACKNLMPLGFGYIFNLRGAKVKAPLAQPVEHFWIYYVVYIVHL